MIFPRQTRVETHLPLPTLPSFLESGIHIMLSCSHFLRRAAFSVALFTLTGIAAAQVFSAPDIDFSGRVRANAQVVLPGDEVGISGQGFTPGQRVTLLRGDAVLNTTPWIADDEGKFTGSVMIPADAAAGIHPIIVRASGPDAAAIFDLKISKSIALSGQYQFRVDAVQLPRGLYQVAYAAASKALFVTRAVGRAPTESEILKLDPDTLDILARTTPPVVPADSQDAAQEPLLYAVYGIGVDDANGTLWVTNTRQNTVAVYRQADLALIKQFPADTLSHPRDVVVNETLGRAYVSTVDSSIAVFDTATLAPLPAIDISSTRRGESFASASLALDRASGKLLTVSISTGEVALIDTATGRVDKVIALKNARSAVGVAWNAPRQRILVAAQGSDNLLIVNPESGEIEDDVYVGAGALNVAYDPAARLAYVSNRGADTITVVNDAGQIVANLDGGSFPNHLTIKPNGTLFLKNGKVFAYGTVFAVNKARGADDANGDHIRRIVRQILLADND